MKLHFDPVIPLLGIYVKNPETSVQKNMHLYVYSSMIYNSQDLETAQVPISRRVDKKAFVHLHNEILPGCIKEGNLTLCNSRDGTGDYYAMCNKPVRERQIPYDLTYM